MFSKHNQQSDAQFFKAILDEYNKVVFAYIAKRVDKRDDVLSIMQEVLIHLWKHKTKLNPELAKAIIFKSCAQEVYKYYQSKHLLTVSLNDMELYLLDNSEEELEQKLEKEHLLDSVYEALNLVPGKRKQIFMMNKLEGKTEKEIALEMNMSPSAIGNQISKTILFLRKKLMD